MNVVAVWPAVLMVLGAIAYLIPSPNNAKPGELGRIAFFVGLFVLTLGLAGHTVRF